IRLSARPTATLTLTAQRNDDGSSTFGVGQEIPIGGPRRGKTPAEERAVRLSAIRIDAADAPSLDLRKDLKLREGKKVQPWDVEQEAGRVPDRLAAAGHLDAVVGARLDGDVAVISVRAGPRYAWRVEGMPDAPDLGDVFRRALFSQEALELAQQQLLRALA